VTNRFLVERMAGTPVAELLISVRADPDFGLAMTIASGGVLVELIGDAMTLLLPAGVVAVDVLMRVAGATGSAVSA
jgi:acyl-CoA synthetase (NDP forming)